MKILYINRNLNFPDGSAVHGKMLIKEFKKMGNEIIIFPDILEEADTNTRRPYKISICIKKFFPPSLVEAIIFIKKLFNSIGFCYLIYKISRKHKPDCILMRPDIYEITPLFLKQILAVPVILEINAPIYIERDIYYNHGFKRLWSPRVFFKLETRIWKKADGIYVVSNVLKDIIKSVLGNSSPPIAAIPNGVDLDLFNTIRAAELLEDQSQFITICFSGSFYSWHGVNLLIRAYENVLTTRPNTRLILIGGGEDKENLEKFVNKNPVLKKTVIFTGLLSHEKTVSILKAVDILVAPYLNLEPFYFSPLKIFEYMGCRKAIVASKIGQIGEIFEDNVNALLVKAGEEGELVSALLKLIDSVDLRTRLGEGAFDLAHKYTWGSSAKELSSFIRSVVKNKI